MLTYITNILLTSTSGALIADFEKTSKSWPGTYKDVSKKKKVTSISL